MDFILVGNKYFTFLTQSDCLRLSEFGYECFDIFFTREEWSCIAEQPMDGHSYFHSDPTAPQFMKYAIESFEPFERVYETLNSLRISHEQRMIENDWPFPDDTY